MSDTVYVPDTNIPIANNIVANTAPITSSSIRAPVVSPIPIDKSKTYLVTYDSNVSAIEVSNYMEYLMDKGVDSIVVPKGFKFHEAKHTDELKAFLKLWLEEL